MYKSLQPRIAKTLLQAFLDHSKPLTTQYGAIVGITALGAEAVEMLILPNITSYYKMLEGELSNQDTFRRQDAQKCFSALLVRNNVQLFEITFIH